MTERPVFVRTAGGTRIHIATCHHARTAGLAGTGVRWRWADDRNSAEIARAAVQHDLQTCRICKPITALARWEREQRAARLPTGTAPTTEELIDFEQAHPRMNGQKTEQIRRLFGVSLARYTQLVSAAVRTEEALMHDAQATHQIQARISGARAARAALLRREPR